MSVNKAINTHGLKADFGTHRGELYTRIPVNYLTWMVNSEHSRKPIAEAELKRRGTTIPEVYISGHAIDRFTENYLNIWRKSEEPDRKPLYSWLCDKALMAFNSGIPHYKNDNKKDFLGLWWVFEENTCWPVLKTVMKRK